MFSFICFFVLVFVLLTSTTKSHSNIFKSIVIQVRGDCKNDANTIAQEHGYRYVRQIFDGFCELEEDPTSINYYRHRRAIEKGIDPAHILLNHDDVLWAETQVPKVRQKREITFNDPEYDKMWYILRHSTTPELPDMNVTGAWRLGYTGRGRVVTIVDDGLETDHPELQDNYDKDASTDINGNDDDPTPRYGPNTTNGHGTLCAGVIAAKANNGICGVGVAYNARIGGIRMLDGGLTDNVESRALSYRPNHIDIYVASWGPPDDGQLVDGPGVLAQRALVYGANSGRNGKGSIFVWASGNGGGFGDSCACDGYVSTIYTIAISSASQNGSTLPFLEECSAILAATYHDIVTTNIYHGCMNHFGGTSAVAPLAAAIYALVLEANPELTWRDIMYITVLGSRPYAIPNNTPLVHNAAGYNVSSKFGFGLMDAGLMIWYATRWINIPSMLTCETLLLNFNKTIRSYTTDSTTLDIDSCRARGHSNITVNYIEQVQVPMSLETTDRGQIEIYLYSPSNTKTQLLPKRPNDHSDQGFAFWVFLTVQLWGENPHGRWKLEVVNTGNGSARLIRWQLIIHGTRDYPISFRSINETNCHIECNPNESCGHTDTSCTSCRHYKQFLTNAIFRCVASCPEGTYTLESEKICLSCHKTCASCRNSNENSCTSCKPGLFLLHESMICSTSCPKNYTLLNDAECVKAKEECKDNEYYDFEDESCRRCNSRCLTCSGPQSSHCTSCKSSSKYLYLQNHTCVSSCSTGFYLLESLSQCLSCHETCLNCTSSNENSCLSCPIGYIYHPQEHRCEDYTNQSYYIDSQTGQTYPCHSSCTECKGPNANDCTDCNFITEVLLKDGHCANDCPLGYFISEYRTDRRRTNICKECPIGCLLCANEHICTICDVEKGYFAKDETCFPTCGSGFYLSDIQCEKCSKPCRDCSNLTNCLSCDDEYYLNKNQCLSCRENDCKTCAEGFQFDEKQQKCISLCSNGQFYNKNTNSCEICTDNCLQCAYPMVLDTSSHRCLPCCTSNRTTNDCCQCSSRWDGYCHHRNQLTILNRAHQIILLVILILILLTIVFTLLLLLIGIRRFSFCKRVETIDYIPLSAFDVEDESR